MGRKGCSQLHPKILDGDEFQFEFLIDRPVISAIPGKSSGRLALEFAFADISDVRADHEAEQMLGINALCSNTARKQRGETQDCRPAGLRANWHSQSHGDETTASLTDNAPYHNAWAGGEESERLIPEFRSAAAPDPARLQQQ